MGQFQRGLYHWLLKAGDDPSRVLLYATMVLYVAPSNLAFAMMLQYVLPIWVILRFIGTRAAPTAEDPHRPASQGTPTARPAPALTVAVGAPTGR